MVYYLYTKFERILKGVGIFLVYLTWNYPLHIYMYCIERVLTSVLQESQGLTTYAFVMLISLHMLTFRLMVAEFCVRLKLKVGSVHQAVHCWKRYRFDRSSAHVCTPSCSNCWCFTVLQTGIPDRG